MREELKMLGAKSRRGAMIRWGLLALVVLIAFGYSLLYAETVGKMDGAYSPDEGNYIRMAQRLLETGEYSFWGNGPDAYVSPGLPLFLTGCMAVFGTGLRGIHAIKIVQCVLAAGTVLLTFIMGWQLTRRYWVGFTGAFLVAINASFAVYSRFLLTENLYYFTMMLFFVGFLWAREQGGLWRHGLAGVLLALTVLVRPLVVILAPFVCVPHLWKNRKDAKAALLPVAAFLAGFLLLNLPWWIRNLVTLHRFIPLATQTNPIYAGLARDVAALGLQDPGSMLGNLKLLLELLITRPLQTVYWMTVGKFQIIFMDTPAATYAEELNTLIRNLTLYPGLLGCVKAATDKKLLWPTVCFVIYLASSFMFVPTVRYSLQYLPMLGLYTGYLLTELFPGRQKQM